LRLACDTPSQYAVALLLGLTFRLMPSLWNTSPLRTLVIYISENYGGDKGDHINNSNEHQHSSLFSATNENKGEKVKVQHRISKQSFTKTIFGTFTTSIIFTMKTTTLIRPIDMVPSIEISEQLPCKKLRPSASVNSVTILAESGISSFKSGNPDEAEKRFRQALCRVDVSFLCTSIQSSLTNIAKDAMSRNKTSAKNCCHKKETIGAVDSSSSATTTTIERGKHSLEDGNAKKSPYYSYQRLEYDEGMQVYNEPLPIKEFAHTDSISSTLLYNIAQTYVNREQYEVAIKWFERALARSHMLDANTPILLFNIFHNLGYCCYRLGLHVESMERYQQALALVVQLGLSEISSAACLNCIGVLHFHRQSEDDDEKTMDVFKQSLAIYRTQLGSNTKEVATILNNIGRVYYLWSKYERALVVYEEALCTRKQLLGEDSVDVAATIYNSGQTYHQLGKLDEAMQLYLTFLGVAQLRHGSESRDVSIVYKRIAEIHHARGEFKLALSDFKKALRSGRASLGKYHPDIACTLNKLGNLSHEMQDLDAAMKYYKEGLEVEFKVLAPNHTHIQITLTNLAHIYKQREDFAGALRTYREVKIMQTKTFGSTSVEVAVTLSSMGLMQYHMNNFDAAFDSYQEALRVRRDFYGSDEHVDVASTLNSIGLVLFKQDMFDLARSCFEQSLRIRQKLLGADHRDVAILWYNIATIYFESGEDQIAVRMYKETLRVERASLEHNHPDIVLTLQHIAQIHQQLGDLQTAMEYFLEALDIERKREGENTLVPVAKILNLAGNIHLQQGNVSEMMHCYVEASRIYQARQQSGEALVITGYNFYGLSKMHPLCAPVA
jgi:tetratricopeptide (TPR) repeat protein